MLIGIVGAPNKGKSTIFSALTMADAAIADYAFTTIKPNLGIAYARRECAEKGLGVRCMPRNSLCRNGTRLLPVNIIDVAGLVPGAHLGRGMGNQFLNDLASADLLIQVVDVSGETDINGNRAEGADPAGEVLMVKQELAEWLGGIVERHMPQLSKREDSAAGLRELLAGFRAVEEQVRSAISAAYLTSNSINWSREECLKFAERFLERSKPMLIAANKLDKAGNDKLERLKRDLAGYEVIGCSGAIELALRKAERAGIARYDAGSVKVEIVGSATPEQSHGIETIKGYVEAHGGTGADRLLDTAVFRMLKKIVVYPVEDENRFTDHFGNVLPDAMLMDAGSTAHDLAMKIHTDIAKGMKYGIDARKRIRIPKEYILKDNDVIKIVSVR